MTKNCDVLIIGAGVVGLSTGIALLQSRPSLKVMVADKEKDIAMHASGRNSGVIHAGFYYSPESLKAKFCRDGNIALRTLAKRHGIPVRGATGSETLRRAGAECNRKVGREGSARAR